MASDAKQSRDGFSDGYRSPICHRPHNGKNRIEEGQEILQRPTTSPNTGVSHVQLQGLAYHHVFAGPSENFFHNERLPCADKAAQTKNPAIHHTKMTGFSLLEGQRCYFFTSAAPVACP